MPLFDFACEACGHRWEAMHRQDEPLPVCPTCGAERTEKLMTIGSAYAPIKLEPGRTYDLPRAVRKKRTYSF